MSITPPQLAAMMPDAQDWAAVRRHPRRNLLAGLTVAIVALPSPSPSERPRTDQEIEADVERRARALAE